MSIVSSTVKTGRGVMPDIYCSACRRATQHKVIMKRCESDQIETLTGKVVSFTQLMAKFVTGEHYYEMEPQYYCRCCNHRAIGEVIQHPARQTSAIM
jgi:ribosomal protein L44E